MTQTTQTRDFISNLGDQLPFLRRYARALTGNQERGDNYAAATLEALLEDPTLINRKQDAKIGLFRAFHAIWSTSGAIVQPAEEGIARRAQQHLSKLTANTREALLLHTIEEFTYGEIALVMEIDQAEAEDLVHIAQQELAESILGKVMIIEDEAIISMDLENIISDMGHKVTGVARTRTEAVRLGKNEHPDLILADIQLADNSSGIDAVNDLLREVGDIPVIFITAFPERLLTGEKPEPAFLITKPYAEEQVRLAASQAMFFSSTDPLKG